jgi:hypothetical protein
MSGRLFVPYSVLEGSALEDNTRERVHRMADSVSIAVSGGLRFHECVAGLLRLAEWARAHLQTADTEEKVSALLASLHEPEPRELARWEVIARLVPAAMNGLVRKMLGDGLVRLPGAKMGRKTIPDSEKLAICDEVAALSRRGMTLAVAKRRVAQRHRSTERTINRVWSKRSEYTIDMDVEKVQAMIEGVLRPQADTEMRRLETPRDNVAP